MFDFIFTPGAPESLTPHPANGKLGGDPSLGLIAGFGPGRGAMHKLDANGRIDVRPGPNHISIFFGKSGDANTYTAADINEAESGLSSDDVFTVANWIVNTQAADGSNNSLGGEYRWGMHPNYALDPELHYAITNYLMAGTARQSIWIHYPDDVDFASLGVTSTSGKSGFPNHPIVRKRYQYTGSAPRVTTRIAIAGTPEHDLVVEGLDVSAIVDAALPGDRVKENFNINQASYRWFFNQVDASGKNLVLQGVRDVGIVMTRMNDAVFNRPEDGTNWDNPGNPDRIQGLYCSNCHGVLLLRSSCIQNGWKTGYETDATPTGPNQPPSAYSHGIYIPFTGSDYTAIECIIGYNSSHGAKWGQGVYSLRTLYPENPIGYLLSGNAAGTSEAEEPGVSTRNISVCYQNVIHGSRWSTVFGGGGGIVYFRPQSGSGGGDSAASSQNAVLHSANPNDLAEVAAKPSTQAEYSAAGPMLPHAGNPWERNDNFVGDWLDYTPQNISLSPSELQALTIHRLYDADVGNDPDTTDTPTLMQALKSFDLSRTVEVFIEPIMTALGADWHTVDTASENVWVGHVQFEGWREDGPYNWSLGRAPIDGDTVRMGDNDVTSALNKILAALYLTLGKTWFQFAGYREITVLHDGGTYEVHGTAELLLGGVTAGSKLINVIDGSLVLVGDVLDDLSVSVEGLAAFIIHSGFDYVVEDGHTLTVKGSECRIGFDGDDDAAASLIVESGGTLAFDPDGDTTISTIMKRQEGFAGLHGTYLNQVAPRVVPVADLRAGSAITLVTTGLASGNHDLIIADTLTIDSTVLSNFNSALAGVGTASIVNSGSTLRVHIS